MPDSIVDFIVHPYLFCELESLPHSGVKHSGGNANSWSAVVATRCDRATVKESATLAYFPPIAAIVALRRKQ